MLRAGDVAEATARAVAKAVGEIRAKPLAKPPGIAEAVEWANAATVLEKGGSPWPEAFRRAHRRADQGRGGPELPHSRARPHPRKGAGVTPARELPRAARPFARLCAGISGASAFRSPASRPSPSCKALTLLGPRSMEDIRQAALATLAPPPDRIAEFDALFRSFFYGEATVTVDARERRGHRGQGRRRRRAARRAAGTPAGGERRVRVRARTARPPRVPDRPRGARRLPPRAALGLAAAPLVPLGSHAIRAASSISAARCARSSAPTATCRRRRCAAARRFRAGLLILIDISGSMKLHTGDYLKLAHTAVQAADRVEVFTLGTRLTRITPCAQASATSMQRLSARRRWSTTGTAARASARRCSPSSACRASPLSRAARRSFSCRTGWSAATTPRWRRRCAGSAHAPSGCRFARRSPAIPAFRPKRRALKAILPCLDDLVDGSSLTGLADFMLSLARPAPSAATIWRRTL